MRIRSVKPEYWQHRMHKRLSVSASLLGAALLDYADDEGRFEAEGARIRGMLVPSIDLEKDVDALLGELQEIGWLFMYVVKMDNVAVWVGQIVAFELHQVIQRPKPSLLPPPDGRHWKKVAGKWMRLDGMVRVVNDSSLTSTNMVAGAVNEADNHGVGGDMNTVAGAVNDESLGSGRKEGKGKEGSEGTHARTTPDDGISDSGKPESEPASEKLSARGVRLYGGADVPGGESESGVQPPHSKAAEIPTVEEVVLAGGCCVPSPAPEGYCRWWHRKFPSVMGGWLRRGFLMDWEWELGNWWRRDQGSVLAGTHASCEMTNDKGTNDERNDKKPGKNGVMPAWKRIRELESQEGPIWTHVANRESAFYSKRLATLAARKELGKLYGELATLKAAEGGKDQ